MLSRIARQNLSLLLSFASFFLCETWWISFICSTWSLHLWFRKPLIEAKDSLAGVRGNADLRGPENPHKWWLALAPSFPPHLSFLLSHIACLLIYRFILCPLFFSFTSLCAIFSCALHLANNMSVENSEECILLLRWVILPLACMPLPQGGWMRGRRG